MVSSRRDDHVKHTVDALKGEGLSVEGTVCHVGKEEHRKQLIQDVSQQEVVGVSRMLIIALFSVEIMVHLVLLAFHMCTDKPVLTQVQTKAKQLEPF